MRLLRHIWQSRPQLFEALSAACLWATLVPLCILADYFLWRHMLPPAAMRVVVIFAIGAFLAVPIALWSANLFGRHGRSSAFSANFLFLSIGTIGFTALIFAFDFWLYFSHWHGTTFSKLWVNQLVFTFASAIYQFLVSGLRLYLPFGFIALIIASLWASRRTAR